MKDSSQHLLRELADITWRISANGEMLSENPEWEAFTGQTKNEYLNKGWIAAVHPEETYKIKAGLSINERLEASVYEDHIRLFNRKKGRYHYLLIKAIPQYNRENEFDGWFGACIDLQELKDKEKQADFNKARYRRLSDLTEEGVCISKDFRIVEVNKAFAKHFGYDEKELIDRNVLELTEDEASRRKAFTNVFNKNDSTFEAVGIRKDGTKFIAQVSGKSLEENGQHLRVTTLRDITKEKEYQKQIEQSEQQFRQLMEQAPFAIELYDTKGYFLDANREFEKTWKLKVEDLQKKYNILQSKHFKDLGISPFLERAFKGETIETPDFEYDPREDGFDSDECKWFKARMYPIYSSESNLKNIVIMYEDISNQKESEKEIIRSFIKGEDKERQRIAKEIHDGLAQYLTAANLNLNSVREDVNLNEKKMERFDLGTKFLKQAMEESRNIAQNLMPKAIKDFGLQLSLESLVKNLNKSSPTGISFYSNDKKYKLDVQDEMNIYRIAQESLNNALKYAEASKVMVQLIGHENELIFTIEDNGKGFSLKDAIKNNHGLGLKSIKNRVDSMNGKFDIHTTTGKGTLLTISIPL